MANCFGGIGWIKHFRAWILSCALDVGIWRCIHWAEEDYSNHPGIRRPGVHLHLHPGDAAEMGGLWFCEVFHQRLVLAGLLHRRCKCAATFPLWSLATVIVWWPRIYTPCRVQARKIYKMLYADDKLGHVVAEILFRTWTSLSFMQCNEFIYNFMHNVISNKSSSILLPEIWLQFIYSVLRLILY